MATVYERVSKLVHARVQAALDSGKVLERGSYGGVDGYGRVNCCAIGAIAMNGDDVEYMHAHQRYEVNAKLLSECGVKEAYIGYVLDSIESGFEGWENAAYDIDEYYRLGVEIAEIAKRERVKRDDNRL